MSILLYLSHVGSFPLKYSEANLKRAFLDMIKAGLEYPPYPQLRDFIDIYLDPLVRDKALVREENKYILVDEGKIGVKTPIIPEALMISQLARYQGGRIMGLRAPVTGPFTLASKIYLSRETYTLENTLLAKLAIIVERLATYVNKVVKWLSGLGYKLIVIDEPILSTIVGAKHILYGISEDDIISAYGRIFNGVSSIAGTHVCGRISRRLAEILLETNVKILDHEHVDTPSNLEVYTLNDLETYDKYIALGVVSSKKPGVEPVPQIVNFILNALGRYGDRVFLVKGDCGFRGLAAYEHGYEIGIAKLKAVRKAVNIVKKEIFGY